jgi:cysteine-rich repeat protein
MVPCGPPTDNGICQRGFSVCRNGAFTACEGAVFPGRRDCGSPQDNDCDGLPDNTLDAVCNCEIADVRTCGAHPGRDGNGSCRAGQQTCESNAQGGTSRFGACSGAVGPAVKDSCTRSGDDSDCNGLPNSGCQCVAGQGNAPCAVDPNNSRCSAQGTCAPCQTNSDCSFVSGGRNLCNAGVCAAPRCGDGIVQPERGETCDDGNAVNGDACSKACVAGRAPRGGTSFAATHLCGVLPNGTVKCWGLNSSGQLGTGGIDSSGLVSPRVAAVSGPAVDVAPLGNSTCAALRDGTVSCWGASFTPSPTTVPGVSGVTQLAGGDDVFCGRQTSGNVICWNLGATMVVRSTGLNAIVQVANGDRHRCALRDDGSLLCSGGNTEGELGQGTIGNRNDTPLRATVFGPVAEVATGSRSTCVRLRTGTLQCVGDGATSGNPTAPTEGDGQPVNVLNAGNAVKIVASEQHLCALNTDDAVFCWGSGAATGSDQGSTTPMRINLPRPAIDIGAGSFTSCALLDDSSVYCWGSYTPTAASTIPVRIAL